MKYLLLAPLIFSLTVAYYYGFVHIFTGNSIGMDRSFTLAMFTLISIIPAIVFSAITETDKHR
jgi:hypothetical protein